MSKANEQRAGHHAFTGKFKAQAIRTARNKEKAWKRHLANHPNDLQAKKDIGRVSAQ